jgi:hypothetical protein
VGDRDYVADAAHTLAACLAQAELLIAERDQVGTGFITGGSTDSQPPWNAAVAYAIMIPWHEVRYLEAQIRRRIGLSELARGGSAGNTREVLLWLVKIAPSLPKEEAAWIASRLEGWVQLTLVLPAVDRLPQWQEVPVPGGGPDCPWCGTPNLRYHEAYGIVACLYRRCPSLAGGKRPWAQVRVDERGAMSWRWEDGTVQP